jgi:hypothetical protein
VPSLTWLLFPCVEWNNDKWSGSYMFPSSRSTYTDVPGTFTMNVNEATHIMTHSASSCTAHALAQALNQPGRLLSLLRSKNVHWATQNILIGADGDLSWKWLTVAWYINRFGGVCCLRCQGKNYHGGDLKVYIEIYLHLYIPCTSLLQLCCCFFPMQHVLVIVTDIYVRWQWMSKPRNPLVRSVLQLRPLPITSYIFVATSIILSSCIFMNVVKP